MDAEVTVRPERDSDHDGVARVVEAAFGRPDEAQLVGRLRAADGRYVPELALVAETPDGGVAGHVMLTYVDLVADDGTTRRVLELAPLAVEPALQRAGVGRRLTATALAAADAMGEPVVLVLGHASYYPRHGFEPAGDHGIEPPDERMRPSFFVARLAAYDPSLRGTVDFGPAFA